MARDGVPAALHDGNPYRVPRRIDGALELPTGKA